MLTKTDRGCALVVEDPLIGRFVACVLKREGYSVIEAQLEEALRTLRENPAAVSLLVTNQPHYFIDFANTLPLIYDAAFPDPELAQRFSCCRTLRKPFRPCELVSCADELAGREPRLTRQ